MTRRVISVAAALMLSYAATAHAGDRDGHQPKAGFVKCGKVDLEFTAAKVSARGMKCPAAKHLFRRWQRQVSCPNDPCERTRVENFVCRFGGSDVLLRLRCTHRKRDKAMKAHWGG